MILLPRNERKKFETEGGMGNFDLGTRLLPEIEFHRRRERERERDRFQLHSFLPSLSPPPPSFIQRLSFASPLLIKDNRVTFDVGPRFLFFFFTCTDCTQGYRKTNGREASLWRSCVKFLSNLTRDRARIRR